MGDARAFLDTNVLVYLYTKDEPKKQNAARETLDRHFCVVSTQVLNEVYNVWLNKWKWNGTKVRQHLDNIETVCDEVMGIQRCTIDKSLALKDLYGYSYYDCLILASALESGCEILFSEDMANQQIIENRLKIVNPFS